MRSSPANASRSFGRAAAVFDLITSSTSGQLDRDTADRLRPPAAARALVAVREPARHDVTSRSRWYEISGNRAVQGQTLNCRCSFLRHTEQPTPSHRREHVSVASAQVNGVIMASVVGKIDDLHFLHWQHHGGVEIGNHFKYIANDFPLTLLSIGIGLGERGVLMEGISYDDAVLAQTTRRTTMLEMRPYGISTERGRRQWRQLLMTVEQRLILGSKRRGMLVDDLSDYLFERSTGHIGSLMELIRRGCPRAIRTRTETLNRELFDSFKIDSAAERARRELAVAFRTRRLTTRPLR